MKRVCTYPIVIIMAALVILGGSGMNVVSFCCGDCQSAGIEGIVEGVCCEIHGHDHEDKNQPTSDMGFADKADAHETCCFLAHVTFDWTNSEVSFSKQNLVVYELIAVEMPDGLAYIFPVLEDSIYENSTGPPFLCPRSYLSFLTTLLI